MPWCLDYRYLTQNQSAWYRSAPIPCGVTRGDDSLNTECRSMYRKAGRAKACKIGVQRLSGTRVRYQRFSLFQQ
jgi:hypothetical protein